MSKLLPIILLTVSGAAAAAEPAVLSLEDTFDVYARAIIQGDETAKGTLRRSLHTVQSDALMDIADTVNDISSSLVEQLSDGFSREAADAVRARLETIRCRVVSREARKPDADGISSAALRYRCTIPDISGIFDSVPRGCGSLPAKMGNTELIEIIRETYATALRHAPGKVHEGEVEFFQVGNEGAWMSFDVLQLYPVLWTQLDAFEAWNKRSNPTHCHRITPATR